MIIDIHTHAFPDALAERAVPYLEEEGSIKAHLDGKISSLLTSMDDSRIDVSVVASIATKPGHFASIFNWSLEIASERIVPFPSIHPEDPLAVDQVAKIKEAGFRGLKLHPYYQRFELDEIRMEPILASIQDKALILLLHTGFDLAFERTRIVDPLRIVKTIEKFPKLKLVTTHFGAWEDWDEVERLMLGKEIYMDTSYSIPFMGIDRALGFLRRHPQDYLLFGSDSPWGCQADDCRQLRQIDIESQTRDLILGGNAARLLGLG